MNWKVEPAHWLKEPAADPGDTYPADALDRQVVAATAQMPEGPIFPYEAEPEPEPDSESSGLSSASISGEFEAAPVDEVRPEPGAPEPGKFTETLEIQLQRQPGEPAEELAEPAEGLAAPAPTTQLEVSLRPNPDAPPPTPSLEPQAAPLPPPPTPALEPEVAVLPPPPTPAFAADPAREPPAATPVVAGPAGQPSIDEHPVGLFIPSLTAPTPAPAEHDPYDDVAPREVPRASSEELMVDDLEVEEVDELEDLEDDDDVGVANPEAAGPPAAPPPPKRAERKRRHWADEVFKEHYLSTMPSDSAEAAEADVAFLERVLQLEDPIRILDAGCGNGRHAFALADRGHQVVGVDQSLDMLLAAGRRNEGRERPVNFLRADLRELPTDAKYDLVCCLGSTFGYYEDEVNKAMLQRFREVLAPGGRIVLQVFNRDYMAARVPCRSWWQGPGCMVLDEVEMNYFANRLRVHRTIVFEDGRQFDHYLFMKAFTLHAIGKALSSIGMRVREVSGSRDTRGRFYGAASPNIWVTAELKPKPKP